MKGAGLVLVFDIPRERNDVKVKVWRGLNKIKAKKLQHSLWVHSDLNKLIEIATYIKNSGGRARILEERFVF